MRWKSRAIFIPIVVIAVLALALSAQAQPTITKKATAAESKATKAFWTRDKVANAPAMVMIDKGAPMVDAAALEEFPALGEEGSSPPGLPAADADQIAQFGYYQDWAGVHALQPLQADTLADEITGTASEYTFYDVTTATNSSYQTILPHRWVGKLTFRTSATTSASCSATAISNNHIVTAAHCVYDTTNNRWYSGWAFTPAYRNGNAPYGTFPYQSVTVLNAWVNLSGGYNIATWARYDVAVIQVGTNSLGKTLNSMVGYAGRAWNQSYTKLNFNAGYPAQNYRLETLPYPAQLLRACINESRAYTTETLGGGCYYGPGISGGPWLLSYKPLVGSGFVNSVNSGLFIDSPNLYGARFNSFNIVPLCNTQGC